MSLDGAANDGTDCPEQCEDDNVESDVENIAGSFGRDTLIGNDGVNVLEGSYGPNTVDGGAGNDLIRGGRAPTPSPGARATTSCEVTRATTDSTAGSTPTGVRRRGRRRRALCETAIGIP